MNKLLLSVIVMAIGVSLAASNSAHAQTPAEPVPAARPEPTPATPPDLPNWWLNSSLFYNPMPTRLLKHFEGTVGYNNSQGNVDGAMLDLKGALYLRKHRTTNRFTAEHNRRDTNYGQTGGTVRTTQSTLSNRVDFDLTKQFVLVGGVENYHDTVLLIDQRTSLFGGVGATKQLNERNVLNVTGGLAYSWFRFEEDVLAPAIARSGETVETIAPSSGALLFMETWRAQLTKTVTLTEQGVFIDYFNKDLGRRWSAGLDLNVPVATHIAISVNYQIKSEINRFTGILGVRPQDRVFTTGIRVTL